MDDNIKWLFIFKDKDNKQMTKKLYNPNKCIIVN